MLQKKHFQTHAYIVREQRNNVFAACSDPALKEIKHALAANEFNAFTAKTTSVFHHQILVFKREQSSMLAQVIHLNMHLNNNKEKLQNCFLKYDTKRGCTGGASHIPAELPLKK